MQTHNGIQMKLVFVRFAFMFCACMSLLNIINMAIDHAIGIDLLYRVGNLCVSTFLCALYYQYMDFNHPSKKP